MTKTFLKGALVAAVAIVATPAFAAPGDFTATAKIVKPLSILKNADLDFGTTTMNPTLDSETVTVAASSGAAAVCGSTKLTCLGGANASFTVNGVGTQTVNLSYGTAPTQLLQGTDAVAFQLNAPSTAAMTNGTGDFFVGGKITVLSTTKPGTYSADLNVTASYQ